LRKQKGQEARQRSLTHHTNTSSGQEKD
jgi:hypothetical protein